MFIADYTSALYSWLRSQDKSSTDGWKPGERHILILSLDSTENGNARVRVSIDDRSLLGSPKQYGRDRRLDDPDTLYPPIAIVFEKTSSGKVVVSGASTIEPSLAEYIGQPDTNRAAVMAASLTDLLVVVGGRVVVNHNIFRRDVNGVHSSAFLRIVDISLSGLATDVVFIDKEIKGLSRMNRVLLGAAESMLQFPRWDDVELEERVISGMTSVISQFSGSDEATQEYFILRQARKRTTTRSDFVGLLATLHEKVYDGPQLLQHGESIGQWKTAASGKDSELNSRIRTLMYLISLVGLNADEALIRTGIDVMLISPGTKVQKRTDRISPSRAPFSWSDKHGDIQEILGYNGPQDSQSPKVDIIMIGDLFLVVEAGLLELGVGTSKQFMLENIKPLLFGSIRDLLSGRGLILYNTADQLKQLIASDTPTAPIKTWLSNYPFFKAFYVDRYIEKVEAVQEKVADAMYLILTGGGKPGDVMNLLKEADSLVKDAAAVLKDMNDVTLRDTDRQAFGAGKTRVLSFTKLNLMKEIQLLSNAISERLGNAALGIIGATLGAWYKQGMVAKMDTPSGPSLPDGIRTPRTTAGVKGAMIDTILAPAMIYESLRRKGVVDGEYPGGVAWKSADNKRQLLLVTLPSESGASDNDPSRAADSNIIVLEYENVELKGLYDFQVFAKSTNDPWALHSTDRYEFREGRDSFQSLLFSDTVMRDGVSYTQLHEYGTLTRFNVAEAMAFWAKQLFLAESNIKRGNSETTTEDKVKALWSRKIQIVFGSEFSEWLYHLAELKYNGELDSTFGIDYLDFEGAVENFAKAPTLAEQILLLAWKSANPKLVSRLAMILVLDPGPYITDIDLTHVTAFLEWYKNLLVLNPGVIYQDIPVDYSGMALLGYEDTLTTYVEEWIPTMMTDGSVTSDLKELILSTIAYQQMTDGVLAEQWSYPPYQLAEWRFMGSEYTTWRDLATREGITNFVDAQDSTVSQEIRNGDEAISIDSLRLFVTGAEGGILVRVISDTGSTQGTQSYLHDGVNELVLDDIIKINSGEEFTVQVYLDNGGKVWFLDDYLINTQHFGQSQMKINGKILEGKALYLGFHDASIASTIGWQKVGTRFESGVDADLDVLTANAFNYLDAQFMSNPDTRLATSWVAATSFDTTTNTTEVEMVEYEHSTTQIYSEIPDSSANDVPVYIYGDSMPSDMLIAGLMLSDYSNIEVIGEADLVDIVMQGWPGVLVVLTDIVPATIMMPSDSGQSYLADWLAAGNQIVSAGVTPFEYVNVGGQSMSTDDFLYQVGGGVTDSSRLTELTVSDYSPSITPVGHTSYQGTSQTLILPLDGVPDSISLSGSVPYDGGSHTFVFAMALQTDLALDYQRLDLYYDGWLLTENMAMDNLRDPVSGEGQDWVLYDEGFRLAFEYIGDYGVDSNYLCFVTIQDALKGTHTLTLWDSDYNQGTQNVMIFDLNNIISWEQTNIPRSLKQYRSDYGGVPDIGAGVFSLTGAELIVDAESLGRESITHSGNTLPIVSNYRSVRLQQANRYRTYTSDVTGQYGECTVRVGGGLLTILDPAPTDRSDYWPLLSKINYVLTGVPADWLSLHGTLDAELNTPYATGDFDGLLAYTGYVDHSTVHPQALVPEQDYSHEGAYSISFSDQSQYQLTTTDSDYSVSGDSLNVWNTTETNDFVISLTGLDIHTQNYLAVSVAMRDCTLTLGSLGAIDYPVVFFDISGQSFTQLDFTAIIDG